MDEFLFRQRPLFLQNWRAAIADPSASLGRGVILLAPNRIIPSNGLVHTGAGGRASAVGSPTAAEDWVRPVSFCVGALGR